MLLFFFWNPARGKKTKQKNHQSGKVIMKHPKSTANAGEIPKSMGPTILFQKKTWRLEEIRTIFIWDIWSRANRRNEIGLNHEFLIGGFLPSTMPTYLMMRRWSVWTTLPETCTKEHLKKMASQKGRKSSSKHQFSQIQTVSLEGGVTWSTKPYSTLTEARVQWCLHRKSYTVSSSDNEARWVNLPLP